MAKLMNMLLLVFAIQVALVLFVGYELPGSTLWNLLTTGSGGTLQDYLKDVIAIAGLGAIVIGSLFVKSDFLVFGGITTVFYSFGASLFSLWRYIDGKSLFGGHEGNPWVAMLFVSPMILMYLYTVLSFWRGRD